MFASLFKKKPVSDTHGEDDIDLKFTYSKIPLSLDLKKRQQEERIRKQYDIPKEKRAELL